MVSMLPDMMAVAVGMAMAFPLRGERRCALSFFGDGATSVGDWHEAMNFAGARRVPVIFVLEHNGYAYSTPSAQQFAVDPIERASGYGIAAVAVDGNDVEAVFAATHEARERALAGGGPTLIAAYTMRMHGHGAHDDASYVPAAEARALAATRPARAPARAAARAGRRRRRARARGPRDRRCRDRRGARDGPADPASAVEGVFCEGPATALGEGDAPWSGFATGRWS